MSDELETLAEKPSDTLLGYCPGYTPSRDFLESAAQYVRSVIQNYNLEYCDALDDVVRSIYMYKLNTFKKDHRVFLYKSSNKQADRAPLSHDELKLREDIERFTARYYEDSRPFKKVKCSESEEATCPTHKKDCNTKFHKIRKKYNEIKDVISCYWYQQNEKTILRNKAYYFGQDRETKVRFEGSEAEADDGSNLNYDKATLISNGIQNQRDYNNRSNESLSQYGEDDSEVIINLPDPPMIEVRSSKRDMRLNNELFDESTNGYSPQAQDGESEVSLASDIWEKEPQTDTQGQDISNSSSRRLTHTVTDTEVDTPVKEQHSVDGSTNVDSCDPFHPGQPPHNPATAFPDEVKDTYVERDVDLNSNTSNRTCQF